MFHFYISTFHMLKLLKYVSDIQIEDAGILESEVLVKKLKNGTWIRNDPVPKLSVPIIIRGRF